MAIKKCKGVEKPLKGNHFTGEIILWLISWYCRYALSYRDLTEMALERGLKLELSTICRWVQGYAPEMNRRMNSYLKMTCDSWKLDKTHIKLNGQWHYFYRAIDKYGDTLDWTLIRNRNKSVAKHFLKNHLAINMLPILE